MNKKGAEMTIGTIIIIVLALIVLVVLVVGFTGGWTNLWGKITAFFGGGDNVDTIVQSCQLACTAGNQYDYCKARTIKWEVDEELVSAKASCKQLANKLDVETDKKGKQKLPNVDLSCEITCPSEPTKKCSDSSLGGVWKKEACAKDEIDLTSQVTDTSDKGDNIACCKKK